MLQKYFKTSVSYFRAHDLHNRVFRI